MDHWHYSGGAEGGECKSGHLEFHVVIPIEGHVPVFLPLQRRLTTSPALHTTRSTQPVSSTQQVTCPGPLLSKAARYTVLTFILNLTQPRTLLEAIFRRPL